MKICISIFTKRKSIGRSLRETSLAGAVLLVFAAGGGSGAPAYAVDNSRDAQDRANTFLGIDVNRNGIRDEVDAYIDTEYLAPAHRAAALQAAWALQWTLQINAENAEAVKSASRRMTNAVNCLYSKFEGGAKSKEPVRVWEELRNITTNNKARLVAYLAYSKALNGTASSLPEGDTCE